MSHLQPAPTDVVAPSLDRYARMVRRALDVPVALVTIVEDDRQVFPVSVTGVDGNELGAVTTTYYNGHGPFDAAHERSGAPTDAGDYGVVVSRAESANYNAASDHKTITIARADFR